MSGYTENAIVHHGVMMEGDELHPEALHSQRTDKKSERSVEPVTAALEMWLANKMSSDQPSIRRYGLPGTTAPAP